MTAQQFKETLRGRIPSDYVYISRNIYTVKGVPIYLVYFNSRIPNVKVSKSVIKSQHTLTVRGLVGTSFTSLSFSHPLLLDEYTKEIRPNSIILFVDLAGSYISKPNNL